MNLRSRRPSTEARNVFRNGILSAAERVFAAQGFHAARIADIARRARVGVGTVYNYFQRKEDVLAALVEERTAEMAACLAGRPDDPAAYPERLERRIGRLLAHARAHRGFACRLLAEAPKGRMRGAWLGVVNEGQAAGALAPLPRDALATFLAAAVRSAVEADQGATLAVRLILQGAGT